MESQLLLTRTKSFRTISNVTRGVLVGELETEATANKEGLKSTQRLIHGSLIRRL